MLFIQESIKSAATSAALKSWRLTSRASLDVLRFGESRDRIRTLEQDVMKLKGHINVAKAKEKTATDAKAFILDCLNATNQQLESKILFFFFCSAYSSRTDSYLSLCLLVFVPRLIYDTWSFLEHHKFS